MISKIGTDVDHARSVLEAGGLVAIPTETVYGLAANALDSSAVLKIFEAKKRPSFDPLIVHLAHKDEVSRYATSIPEKAQRLANMFWPGPLTLVLRKAAIIPDEVTSGLDTVGLRVPSHPLAVSLLAGLSFPLAAPSANPFGYVSPTRAVHVQDQLGSEVDYILDGGTCTIGLESTIVAVQGERVEVLRLGGLSVEQIESAVGPVEVSNVSSSRPEAPGMLLSHYAPRKPLLVGEISSLQSKYPESRVAVLGFRHTYGSPGIALSETGDVREAATRLFSALRTLEGLPIDVILAEYVPNAGLGRAINDRLRRASYSL